MDSASHSGTMAAR